MNNSVLYIGIIIVILIVIFVNYMNKNKGEVENLTDDFMPESAAEACKKISSKADEIEAHYDGVANIAKNIPFYSLFSPQAWASGKNESEDVMRNIVNSVMTQEDKTKIISACEPVATSIQRNVIDIDLSQCKYCDNHPCAVKMTNVLQENIDIVKQTCMIQTAIDILMQNKKSVDAQALAQTLQKTQDLLSGGNTSKKDNCNVINSQMKTESYLESISKCAQISQTDQENKFDAKCAASIDVTNLIQKNKAEKLQECIIGTTVDKALLAEEENKAKVQSESKQESSGLNPLVFAGSSSVSCIFSIVVGVVLYFYKDVAMEAAENY